MITLAAFGLLDAARPVLYREREIRRKRVARAVAAAQRDHARKIESDQERIAMNKRMAKASLVITCKDGRVIRPIK